MKPLSLRLKGFRGIRDGLGLDEVCLDLEALPAAAQLVALAGANGKGKSTLMDNLHPYTVMPSRAGADGLGAFSYYDHLCSSEAEKDLVWEHEGSRYRSHLVLRMGGNKRKAEAYLFEHFAEHSVERSGKYASDGGLPWTPVRIFDGTVSDGKMDTYERCVEAILGSAQTFFTSVFSAQGKRQISALRNGEVKSLLADLLNLEDIRQTGQRASETVRLIKAGLVTLRQERVSLAVEMTRASTAQAALGDVPARTTQAQEAKATAVGHLAEAQAALAQLSAQREAASVQQQRRDALVAERDQAMQTEAAAAQAQQDADKREKQRLAQIATLSSQRAHQSAQRLRALDSRKGQLAELLGLAARTAWASHRIALAERVVAAWQERRAHWSQQVERLKALQGLQQTHAQRIASIEREAGQATLRVNDLVRRLALTEEVPCVGTDLQGRCKLLGDAREAQTLKPSADVTLERLCDERRAAQQALEQTHASVEALADAPAHLTYAEHRLSLAMDRARRLHDLTRQASAMQRAQSDLLALETERQQLALTDTAADTSATHERHQIQQALDGIEATSCERQQRHIAHLARIDADLATLPAPFDVRQLTGAQTRVEAATQTLQSCEAAHAHPRAVRAHLEKDTIGASLAMELSGLGTHDRTRPHSPGSDGHCLGHRASQTGIRAGAVQRAAGNGAWQRTHGCTRSTRRRPNPMTRGFERTLAPGCRP